MSLPTTYYAQAADVEAYIEGWVTDDSAALQRLIQRAERDVDTLLAGYGTINATTGLKYDPVTDLEGWQADALTRAVCAQVDYRFRMGEDFFVQAQYDRQQGPDFTVEGKLPYLGPQVERELSASGLMRAYGIRSVSTSAVDPYSRYGLLSHIRAN